MTANNSMLRIMADGVNNPRPGQGDHSRHPLAAALNNIVPDFVQVLARRQIVKEGGKELVFELEEKDWVKGAISKT